MLWEIWWDSACYLGNVMTFAGVEPLIKDREFGALLADKAFDADWLVKDLTERGSKVVIPPRSNRKAPREYNKEMYKWRHLVENFFCKLKELKKVVMWAEKTDSSFSANTYLAALLSPCNKVNRTLMLIERYW